MKRMLSLLLALAMLIGMMPQFSVLIRAEKMNETTFVQNEFSGKTISILGDSISTYEGVSNDASVNSTLSGGAIYYTPGKQGIYQADTWWQQTIDALGMELLVNNSWSGSAVLHTRSGTVGAYIDRCVQLHNAEGETPDIIAVFLGTNDFSYYQSTLGTADIVYDLLITDNGDGTFTYATPTTTCEAYAIMLHKMAVRYPDAEIYCMTMLPRREDDHDNKDVVPQPTAFNAELKKIIQHFGCAVVDLENCGIPTENEVFDRYITDQRVHPGPEGMDKITQALVSAMLGRETQVYSISGAYSGVQTDNMAAVATEGMAYCANLSITEAYFDLRISITMGGEDITQDCYADGAINIPQVTGDIVINAVAQRKELTFRWEYSEGALVSVGEEENELTKLAGTVTDGLLSNTYYRMEHQVILRHNLPWVLEWSASGSWSGMIFSAKQTSSTDGNIYLFKTNGTNGFIGFGQRVGSQYHNYGIELGALGVDTTQKHTYRLENRIADDGSNMVYLFVDGVDYGAMNNYYIGGNSNQGTKVEWLNGKDLTFSYIGANGHAINNCALDYIQVWENACAHTYDAVVTVPTCTEQGYTTHTCATCGDSYVDSYTDRVPLKILLIGNSFSWDAADAGYGIEDSQMYAAITAMLKEGYSVQLGVVVRGSTKLDHHYAHRHDATDYKYTRIDLTNGKWSPSVPPANTNISTVLQSEDWDIVILQPYREEMTGGNDAQTSLENLLDYLSVYAEGAKIYYYMPWSATDQSAGDTLAKYWEIAAYTEESIIDIVGNHSTNRFAGIIPVGTAIQNARGTYLNALYYSDKIGGGDPGLDSQRGLERDAQHVSFCIGRYIAGVIMAETLIPEEMRKESYSWPDIKDSPAIGALPEEYTEIAQAAIRAALENPFAVTMLPGYEEDPADTAKENIESGAYSFTGIENEAQLLEAITQAVKVYLQGDFSDPVITIDTYWLDDDGTVLDFTAQVQIRFGYTSRTAQLVYHKHTYSAAVTAPTCTEQGYTTHTCTACGDSYVDSYTDAIGHSFGDWYVSVPSTGTTNGEERRDCEDCDHFETRPLPLLGDVNGDGAVNTRDSRLLMCYELELIDETMLDLRVADVNGDGEINTSDAKLVMQLEIGLITEFPKH